MAFTAEIYGLFLLVVCCICWLRWPHHAFNRAKSMWVAVLLCLIAIDLLFFRAGLVWRFTPDFGTDFIGAQNWYVLFAAAREFETQRAPLGKTDLVGSSAVLFGADKEAVDSRLHAAGVPPLLLLATHGSSATDSAVLVWNSLPTNPWLVLYGATARDFAKAVPTDTGVIRTFYDSSIDLPALPRQGAEAVLDAAVKRYWKLYRYRFFTREVAETLAGDLMVRLSLPRPAAAADGGPASLPPEALQYFSAYGMTPQAWAAWSKWRQSRQFADYLEWMKHGFALEGYQTQTLAAFGPEGNPQVESLRWMLGVLQERRTRCVIVYFPENPVFHDPAARAYFDPALSLAYAELFKREAEAHGARFVDLRDFIEPEGFYDLIHLNGWGQRKMSERLVTIVREEWERRAEGAR